MQKCRYCGKSSLTKDEVGLSKKMLGRDSGVFFCLPCLARYMDTSQAWLLNRIQQFKNQGCSLF